MRVKPDTIRSAQGVFAQSEQEPDAYPGTVLGRAFTFGKGVFSPKYFADTEFFAAALHVRPGERFLEIGPGAGPIVVTKALEGAVATAVDINPRAIELTSLNAAQHNVSVEVYVDDMFAPFVGTGRRFDTIFWNHPFGYVPAESTLSLIERSVWDPGYRGLRRYITEGRHYLAAGGRLLLGFSETLGDPEGLREIAARCGSELQLLVRTHDREFDLDVTFEIFEIKET